MRNAVSAGLDGEVCYRTQRRPGENQKVTDIGTNIDVSEWMAPGKKAAVADMNIIKEILPWCPEEGLEASWVC